MESIGYSSMPVLLQLSTGEVNVGDADHPLPYASPSGYCKKSYMPTDHGLPSGGLMAVVHARDVPLENSMR
ncbi:MAG: hypothetical protein WB438_04300 [Candidatus Cybelea sp.]